MAMSVLGRGQIQSFGALKFTSTAVHWAHAPQIFVQVAEALSRHLPIASHEILGMQVVIFWDAERNNALNGYQLQAHAPCSA
jgi:hypothetical protein